MNINYIHNAIRKFIDELDLVTKANVAKALGLLEAHGHKISMPVSKPLGHGLFELRIKEIKNIRIIYCFYNNEVWILHIFDKKTNKIERRELELAMQRHKTLID